MKPLSHFSVANENGFTLVEMVIAGALGIAIMMGVTQIFVSQKNEISQLENKIYLEQAHTELNSILSNSTYCRCLFNGKTYNSTTSTWNALPTSIYGSYSDTCVSSGTALYQVDDVVRGTKTKLQSLTLQNLGETVQGSGQFSGHLIFNFASSGQDRSVKSMTIPITYSLNLSAAPGAQDVTTCRSAALGARSVAGGGGGGSSLWEQGPGGFIYYPPGQVGLGAYAYQFYYQFNLKTSSLAPNDHTIAINGMPIMYHPDQAQIPATTAFGNGLRRLAGGGIPSLNSAVGIDSLLNFYNGSHTVAVGASSAESLTGSMYGVVMGAEALQSATTQAGVAVGAGAFKAATTMPSSVGIGKDVARQATSASGVVFVGSKAGENLTGSYYGNTGVGYQAMSGGPGPHTTNNSNTAIGARSMASVGGGFDNTFVGADSGKSISSGQKNTGFGYGSLENLTTGDRNLAIGYKAGSAITTGSGNVVIGGNSGSAFSTANNNILIADGVGNPRIYIDGGGAGQFYGSLGSPSDARLKKDITPLEDSLNKILLLRGVYFYWKDPAKTDKRQIGFIAQEVEKIFPEAVHTGLDGFKAVSYSELIAPVVEAIKAIVIEMKSFESRLMARFETLRSLNPANAQVDMIDEGESESLQLLNSLCQQQSKSNACR